MGPTDIKQLMAGKRHEPRTPAQWRIAEAGAAQCDQDWNTDADAGQGGIKYGDALIGWNKYYRAAYELRYHELTAANAAWMHGREPYPGREAVKVRA